MSTKDLTPEDISELGNAFTQMVIIRRKAQEAYASGELGVVEGLYCFGEDAGFHFGSFSLGDPRSPDTHIVSCMIQPAYHFAEKLLMLAFKPQYT